MLSPRALGYGSLLVLASLLIAWTGAAPITTLKQQMVQISNSPLVWWQVTSHSKHPSSDVDERLAVNVTIHNEETGEDQVYPMQFKVLSKEASDRLILPPDDQEGYIDEATARTGRRTSDASARLSVDCCLPRRKLNEDDHHSCSCPVAVTPVEAWA